MSGDSKHDEEVKDLLQKVLSTLENLAKHSQFAAEVHYPVHRSYVETSVLDKYGVPWHWERPDSEMIIIRENISLERWTTFHRETLVARNGNPTAITDRNKFPFGSIHPLDEPGWKKTVPSRRYSDTDSTGLQAEKLARGSDKSTVYDPARPTYIKVHKKWLDPATLDAYNLPWEWDQVC